MVRKTKKKTRKIDFEKERRQDKNTIIAIGAIAAVVAVLVVVSYSLNHATNGSDKASIIDGVGCEKVQSDGFHSSAHLDLFVGGRPYEVPSEIGVINGTCRYWLNTQDESGILHLDAPQSNQFTLGQFYDIWKATSSPPPPGTPEIYINGKRESNGINETAIGPGDEIAVIYGYKPSIIPSSYHFS